MAVGVEDSRHADSFRRLDVNSSVTVAALVPKTEIEGEMGNGRCRPAGARLMIGQALRKE